MRGATQSRGWTVWIEVLLGLAVAVAVLGRGADGAAPSLVFLIGAGAVAFTAYTTYRALAVLNDDRLPTAVATEDHRDALEYEKNLALAALKELEVDAATGKVDARDLPTLKASAEARALALIKQIREEDEHWRRRAESEVGGVAAPSSPVAAPAASAPAPAAPGLVAGGPGRPAPGLFDDRPAPWEGLRCTACGFDDNPPDARFCAGCGRPRERA